MAEVLVETTAGTLRGRRDDGLDRFLGIPYATPPLESLRFLPPEPHPGWSGVRDALQFGPASIQEERLNRAPVVPIDPSETSEDCCYLNVWTPDSAGGRRPVLFYIHGGGYITGSGSWPFTDGSRLARDNDVVVVSLNHRLGLLGLLYLGELLGEQYSAGNSGMLDIVRALQWVRENIAAFGGDPEKVTIFGESGGGGKVTALLAMPAARGLFKRAIIESGTGLGAGRDPGIAIEEAHDATEKALSGLGLTQPRDLLTVPVERLLDLQHELMSDWTPGGRGGRPLRPVIDGVTLLDNPRLAIAAGCASEVALIIGSNLDESRFFLWSGRAAFRDDPTGFDFNDAELRQRISARVDEHVDDTLAHYKTTRPQASNLELYTAITSDFTRVGALRLADAKLAGGGEPVFTYLFSWRSPFLGGALGAAHTFELPFVFDTLDSALSVAEGPRDLVHEMGGAWSTFARTGQPNRNDLALWEPHTGETRATMIFDAESRTEHDPYSEDRRFWYDRRDDWEVIG